jgi:hypothetical protein
MKRPLPAVEQYSLIPSGHLFCSEVIWVIKGYSKILGYQQETEISYLYIGILAHIFDLLYCYLWVNITFEYYFS